MEHPWDWLVAVLGGGGLGAVIKWADERGKGRSYLMGAVDKAVQTAMGSLENEVRRLGEKVEDCEKHREECETKLTEERRAREKIQRQIDKLLEGPVATYVLDDSGQGAL